MNQLLYPVELNEVSSRVQQLQTALAALGMPVADDERAQKKAGDTTLKNVRALQAKLNVPVDNNVLLDTATATAIESELKARGIITDQSSFTVRGTVYGGFGDPVIRATLTAYDVDLQGAGIFRTVKTLDEIKKNGGFEPLGNTVSDKDGNYALTFKPDQFKNAERKKADVVFLLLH